MVSSADFDSVGVSSTLAFAAIRLRLTDNKRTKYPHRCRPVTSRVRTKHWGIALVLKTAVGQFSGLEFTTAKHKA